MMLLYNDGPICLHAFSYKLGSVQRNLQELQADKLLVGTVEDLSAIGYCHNYGLSKDETLLSLASKPLSIALQVTPKPRELISALCYSAPDVIAYELYLHN